MDFENIKKLQQTVHQAIGSEPNLRFALVKIIKALEQPENDGTIATVFHASNGSQKIANYVWVNKTPDSVEGKRGAACSVPLNGLNRALRNARRYPDVGFNIWIDGELLDQESLETLQSHISDRKLKNVELVDLNAIPIYADDPLFSVSHYKSLKAFSQKIWERSDYARLLVLSHCLAMQGVGVVYYADFDVPNLQLNAKSLEAKIENFGVACSRLKSISQGVHGLLGGKPIIENGFFSFSKGKGERFLNGLLIPFTRLMITELDERDAAYAATKETFEALSQHFECKSRLDLAHRVQPMINRKIPINWLHVMSGKNPLPPDTVIGRVIDMF